MRQPKRGFRHVNDLVENVGVWAQSVFTKATPASICEHLRREVAELTARPDDVEEAADCALLLFHLAHKQGWNLQQAILAKHQKNTERRWGVADAAGVVEHVRTDEEKVRDLCPSASLYGGLHGKVWIQNAAGHILGNIQAHGRRHWRVAQAWASALQELEQGNNA